MKRWLFREPPAGSPPRGLARELSISPLLLDILCRLTLASTEQGTQGRAPEQHNAELSRTAGSSLEQAWLAHVSDNGYR